MATVCPFGDHDNPFFGPPPASCRMAAPSASRSHRVLSLARTTATTGGLDERDAEARARSGAGRPGIGHSCATRLNQANGDEDTHRAGPRPDRAGAGHAHTAWESRMRAMRSMGLLDAFGASHTPVDRPGSITRMSRPIRSDRTLRSVAGSARALRSNRGRTTRECRLLRRR